MPEDALDSKYDGPEVDPETDDLTPDDAEAPQSSGPDDGNR
jgi:hypothetical protein